MHFLPLEDGTTDRKQHHTGVLCIKQQQTKNICFQHHPVHRASVKQAIPSPIVQVPVSFLFNVFYDKLSDLSIACEKY